METGSIQETWQVEANGQVYEAQFDELASWIAEGALLRIDRVRKGNLRWIEAGKVPALTDFFNAKDADGPAPPVITTSTTEVLGVAPQPRQHVAPVFVNSAPPDIQPAADVCAMHPDAPAAFVCDTCANSFCKACPSSYGGTVKICPFCGAMCNSLAAVEKQRVETMAHSAAMGERFGFGDFTRALAYPFKFKASLFFGAVMFMIFSIGQSAGGMGNIFLVGAGIVSFMLSNMLTFGILANTVGNFTQGKLDQNFMPSFDDFSLWDDVVHPFFLSIGVYISSFGPLIAVVAIAVFMFLNTVSNAVSDTAATGVPIAGGDLPAARNAPGQIEAFRNIASQTNANTLNRIQAVDEGDEDAATLPPANHAQEEEAEFARLNEMIQQSRKQQLESTIGKAPDTVAAEQRAMVCQILGYGAVFLLLAGLALIWGLFYFPAACAVAGYTQSFVATVNPSVGLDTIRRLGSSYFLILLMGFLLAVASGFVSAILGMVFIAFDMPGVGNMPAKAIGSLFGFYLSVVFSCIIGYALYKASDRLQLYR
jgi:hypothetical protein